MRKRVRIISRKDIFKQSFFRLEEAQLQYERYDGTMSPPLTRISFERRDAVAALLHNPTDDTIVLIEQFRYPALKGSDGWLRELPAGVVDPGEDPQQTMERELVEETGYHAEILHHIHTFYTSPGGSSERIHLYYARIHANSKRSKGGGLAKEGEDIKTEVMKVDAALKLLQDGAITDAKTLIGLQWLQLNRHRLPK